MFADPSCRKNSKTLGFANFRLGMAAEGLGARAARAQGYKNAPSRDHFFNLVPRAECEAIQGASRQQRGFSQAASRGEIYQNNVEDYAAEQAVDHTTIIISSHMIDDTTAWPALY